MINQNTIDTITISLDNEFTTKQQEFDFDDSTVITLDYSDASLSTGTTIGDITLNGGHTVSLGPSGYTNDWIVNSNLEGNSLDVKGDANFEGDIKIKGKSLTESLEKIEEKLAILRPNSDLESRWEKLRELRKQYMELEKEIIEKEKIWNILKK